jgi:peptidyl-prolyl cis-trans isomerase C
MQLARRSLCLQKMVFCFLVGAITWGCSKQKTKDEMPSEFVVKVGNNVITEQMIHDESLKHSSISKSEAVNRLIRRELFYQEAIREGFDKKPEIQTTLRNALIDNFIASKQSDIELDAVLTDAMAQQYYKDHLDTFGRPEKWRISLIFVKKNLKNRTNEMISPAQRIELIRSNAIAGSGEWDFARLARQFSENASLRNSGGDCGWLVVNEVTNRLPSEVAKQVLAMHSDGEISPVIPTAEGFYIVRLANYKPAETLAFGAVKDRVYYLAKAEMLERRQDKLYGEMFAHTLVQTNMDKFPTSSTKDSAVAAKPPSMPAH